MAVVIERRDRGEGGEDGDQNLQSVSTGLLSDNRARDETKLRHSTAVTRIIKEENITLI